MSNTIDTILEKLTDELEQIQGQSVTLFKQTYTYLTKTASVDYWSQVKSTIKDKNLTGVAYNITYDQEEYEYTDNGIIQCTLNLILEANVRAETTAGTEVSKNKINSKMNDVIQDVRYTLYRYHDVGNTSFHIYPLNSSREYTTNNDIINGGKLLINCQLIYSISALNPDKLIY